MEKPWWYGIEIVNPDAATGTHKIALLDVATLSSPRFLEANPRVSKGVQFTADGKAVAYPIAENGVDNIWVQPIDGGPGRQITQLQFRADPGVSLVAGRQESRRPSRPHRLRRRPSTRIKTLDCSLDRGS